MAFETQSSAPRTKDTAGTIQQIKTFSENVDGSGEQIQAVALTGINGAKAGVPALPLHVQGSVDTEEQETPPTDASKNNPSFALTYVAGDLTQVDMVIGGTTYRKTLTWVAGDLTAVSAWSAV